MWGVVNRLFVVFLDADWYRYLWIFKWFRGAYFMRFWQNKSGIYKPDFCRILSISQFATIDCEKIITQVLHPLNRSELGYQNLKLVIKLFKHNHFAIQGR
jgi:hypothetical protein